MLYAQMEYCGEPVFLNPKPTGNAIFCAAQEGDQLYTFGTRGTILRTEDLTHWTELDRFTNNDFFGCFRFRNRIYLLSEAGMLYHAENAAGPWAPQQVHDNLALSAAASNEDRAVIVGDLGLVLTSEDGIQWTSLPQFTSQPLEDVIWTGSQFVTVGWQGALFISPDGLHWTDVSFNDHTFLSVEWNGTILVASGLTSIYTSADGVTWTERLNLASANFFDVFWTGSNFVVVGGRYHSYQSSDGLVWESIDTQNTQSLYQLTWFGDRLVGTGSAGVVVSSMDGKTWETNTDTHWSGSVQSILYTGERYLATGPDFAVLASEDGITWRRITLPLSIGGGDLATNGDLIVMVGAGEHVLTSYDGLEWTAHLSVLERRQTHVVWNGSFWLATNSWDEVLISTDGMNWEQHYIGNTSIFSDLIWADDKFFAIAGADIFESQDGINWSRHHLENTSALNDIVWSGSRFVVVAGGQTILYSDNGTEWNRAEVPPEVLGLIKSVSWNGYFFIATSFHDYLLMSYDGIHWKAYPWPISTNITTLEWINGAWIGGGSGAGLFSMPCMECLDPEDFKPRLPQWRKDLNLFDLIYDATRLCSP